METLEDAVNFERDMVLGADEKYGAPYLNAFGFSQLLQNFVKVARPEAALFIAFLAQVKKHHTLAMFSTIRLHDIQAKMNERQVIEAGVNAAYALAQPEPDDFVVKDEDEILHAPKKLTIKRNKWLEDNHKGHSDFLKRQKEIINNSQAHSSLIQVFQNFSMENWQEKGFQTSFFDSEDDFMVKSDLWFLGNLAMGLMDLFYGINRDSKLITFKDTFIQELKALEAENHRIKAEMENSPRIARWRGYSTFNNHKG